MFSLSKISDSFSHLLGALLLSITILTSGINADCVTYDVCHRNNDHSLNCPYEGPGFNLTNAIAEEILMRRCPDFYSDISQVVCCSPQQVIIMDDNIQMLEGIFGRCQTCIKNLLKSICALACHPDQDRFMKVTETRFSQIFQKDYVHSVELRIDLNYTTKVYESCKDVIHPASGREAMELACGVEASKCYPDRWFFYVSELLL